MAELGHSSRVSESLEQVFMGYTVFLFRLLRELFFRSNQNGHEPVQLREDSVPCFP